MLMVRCKKNVASQSILINIVEDPYNFKWIVESMSCFVLIFNKSKKLNREKHYFWLKLHLSSNNITKCKNNTAKTPFFIY